MLLTGSLNFRSSERRSPPGSQVTVVVIQVGRPYAGCQLSEDTAHWQLASPTNGPGPGRTHANAGNLTDGDPAGPGPQVQTRAGVTDIFELPTDSIPASPALYLPN